MAQSYHSTALPMPVPTMVVAVDMRPVWGLVTATDMVFFLVGWSAGKGSGAAAGDGRGNLGGPRERGQPRNGEFRVECGPVRQHGIIERGIRGVVERRRVGVAPRGHGAEAHKRAGYLGQYAGEV